MLKVHLFRLFLLLFVAWMLLSIQSQVQWLGAPGLEFFTQVTWLNFVFITLGGIGYFSMAITEEKEDMTLGLLRMADVGPLALLLGKSVPRLFGAVVLLSIQFPFTMLSITMGGVTVGQVAAAYTTLLAYTLLLAAVGLFWSVVSRTSSTASFWTAVVILGFLFFPWWLSQVVIASYTGPVGRALVEALEWMYEASPVYRLNEIMTTGFMGRAVGHQTATNTLAAVGFFLLSWATFDLFNRDERQVTPARGVLPASTARLRRLVGGRVWKNALFWKDFQFVAGGATALLVRLFLYGLAAVALAFAEPWLSWRGAFSWEGFGQTLMTAMLVAFLLEGIVLAARVFEQEVKWNTLPAIMLLPISTPAIAYSKAAGAAIGLVPSMFWFFAGALITPASLAETLDVILGEPGFWWTVVQYLLLLHLCAYLSLFAKWAAVPVSFGLLVFMNMCCGWIIERPGGLFSEWAFFGTTSFLSVVAIAILHVGIGFRLNEIAGSSG